MICVTARTHINLTDFVDNLNFTAQTIELFHLKRSIRFGLWLWLSLINTLALFMHIIEFKLNNWHCYLIFYLFMARISADFLISNILYLNSPGDTIIIIAIIADSFPLNCRIFECIKFNWNLMCL